MSEKLKERDVPLGVPKTYTTVVAAFDKIATMVFRGEHTIPFAEVQVKPVYNFNELAPDYSESEASVPEFSHLIDASKDPQCPFRPGETDLGIF